MTKIFESRILLILYFLLISASSLYFFYKFTILINKEAIDFNHIWLSSKLWAEGKNPYTKDFYEQGKIIFSQTHAPNMFFYPFNWAIFSLIFGNFDVELSTFMWRFLFFVSLFLGNFLIVSSFKFNNNYKTFVFFILSFSYILISQFTHIGLYLGQTTALIYLGISLMFYGAARYNRLILFTGIIIVMLKPQIGLPLVASLMVRSDMWLTIVLAAFFSCAMALPAFLSVDVTDSVYGLLYNISHWDELTNVNSPASTTGLRNLVSSVTGWSLSGAALVILATILSGVTAYRICQRSKDSHCLWLSLLNAIIIILAVVPLHTYDFLIIVPVLIYAILSESSVRWLVIALLLVLMRSDNIAQWTGFHEAQIEYFHGSLINSLVALFLLGWGLIQNHAITNDTRVCAAS